MSVFDDLGLPDPAAPAPKSQDIFSELGLPPPAGLKQKPESALSRAGSILTDPNGGVMPAIGSLVDSALPSGGPKQGWLGDTMVDIARAPVSASQTLSGLANLATAGGSGSALDALGYDPKAAQAALSEHYSPQRKQAMNALADSGKLAEQKYKDASGAWDTTKALLSGAGDIAGTMLTNPGLIQDQILQTAPDMVMGAGIVGGVAKKIFSKAAIEAGAGAGIGAERIAEILAGRAAPATTAELAALDAGTKAVEAASGKLSWLGHGIEGAQTAGQNAEQLREDNPDNLAGQYLQVPAGVITGLIGRAATKVPGFGDVQTAAQLAMAGPKGSASKLLASGNLPLQMLKGGISEGLFQELPQSAQEQVWQNLAEGKPWDEGVLTAGVQGAVVGGAMGLGEGAISHAGRARPAPKPDATAPTVEELNAGNAELAGAQSEYLNNIPRELAAPPVLPTQTATVPTSDGGVTTINRDDGVLSAAVVDTGIAENMLKDGMPLQAFPDRLSAQAELDSRPDADRMTIAPHPRAQGRFAVVSKDRLTLNALDEANARRQQKEQEDGNASRVAGESRQGQGPVAPGGAGTASGGTGSQNRSGGQPGLPGAPVGASGQGQSVDAARTSDAALDKINTSTGKMSLPRDVADKAVREGREYESRLWGGAYSYTRLRTAAKDAPIRKIIETGRANYNKLRESVGLPKVTDWTKLPDVLVQHIAAGDAANTQETAKQSRPRTVRAEGESQEDFELRRAAEATAARQARRTTIANERANADDIAEITRVRDQSLAEDENESETTEPRPDPEIVDVNTLPDQSDVKGLSKQVAKSIERLAGIFRKRVVFFSGEKFADGFWRKGNTIYIHKDSNVSALRVLGHEMLHVMERESPAAYKIIHDALTKFLTPAELRAQFQDYFVFDEKKNKWSDAQIDTWLKDPANKKAIVDEWMADLSGNRFGEADFWTSVFQKVEDQHGAEAAKGIINRLRLAIVRVINNLLAAIKGGTQFGVDARMAENLEEIRAALAEGFAQYAIETKRGVAGAEAEGGVAKFSKPKPPPGLTKKELKELADKEATRIVEGKTVEQSNPLDDEQWTEVRRIALQKLKPMQRAAALKAEREYLALSREADLLAEKYKDRAADVLTKVKENGSSSVSIIDGAQPVTVEGTGKLVRGKPKVLTIDIGRFFLGRQSKIDISTEAGRRAAGIALAREAAYALTQDGHAVGWYDRKVRAALAISALVHPELLTSKKAQVVFKMIAAITSNGQVVRDNFILANIAYSNFKNGVPLENVLGEGGGARRGAMNKSLVKLRNMIEDHGAERVGEIMLVPLTVKEIQKQFGMKVSGEHMTTVLPAAVGLGGPKIGSFFANLSGHFDSLTMDMWFMRTVGRITGNIVIIPKTVGVNLNELASILPASGEWNGHDVKTLRAEIDAYNNLDEDEQADVGTVLETVPETILYARAQLQKFSAPDENGKSFTQKTLQNENARRLVSALDSTNDSPGNGAERNNLRGVVEVARNLLARSGIDLNVADMQAVLWYYEKNLFTKLGANNASAKPWDYASAARFGIGRTLGLVDVKSSKRAGQVGSGEQPVAGGIPGEVQQLGKNAGQKVKQSRARVIFEVAPDPNNKALTAAWNTLSANEKLAASESVANIIVPKVLRKFGATGDMSPQIGGYMGESNPSFTIKLDSGNPDVIAKASGHVLSQEMMIAVSDKPFDGGVETGALTIEIGNADPAQIYSQIYAKVKQAEGHTTVDGQMIIINNPDLGITLDDLASQVDAALGGTYDVYADGGVYASFPTKESYGYDGNTQEQSSQGSPDSQWAGQLRAEANQLLERELNARGIKLSLPRSDVAGDERAGRRTASDAEALPSYGTATPGAVAAQGFHYSSEERSTLDGRYYGTGAKGRESDRVNAAADKRLKERIYFYVDAGKGITPEQGVGAKAHTVNLNNLYDASAETWIHKQLPRGLSGAEIDNAFEAAVIDNGFDGYIADFGTQRAAVLIGRHNVPVSSVGAVSQSRNKLVVTGYRGEGGDYAGEKDGLEYFAETEKIAKTYGNNVRKETLRFNNPLDLTDMALAKRVFDDVVPDADPEVDLSPVAVMIGVEYSRPQIAEWAKNHGYDGIIIPTTEAPDSMKIAGRAFIKFSQAKPKADPLAGRKDLPFGQMSGAEWKRLVPEATMLEDDKSYYKDDVARALAPKMSPARLTSDRIKAEFGGKADIKFSTPRAPFYSELSKQIEKAPDRIFGPAAQVKLWLAGNAPKLGIKKEEIQWSGINEWLDLQGKAKVSKAEVLGYLANNGVQIEEVEKGVAGYNEDNPQLPVGQRMRVIKATDGAKGYEVLAKNGKVIGIGATEAGAISDAYSGYPELWEKADATKYGQWQLPGGDNYRELLLTLPNQGANRLHSLEIKVNAGNATLAEREEYYALLEEGEATGSFRSNHWEEANILAHVRFNDRTDADGNKVLFIEEVQSDWGQEGKKKGFDVKKYRVVDLGTNNLAFAGGDNLASKQDAESAISEFIAHRVEYGRPAPERGRFDIIPDPLRETIPSAPFVSSYRSAIYRKNKAGMYEVAYGSEKNAEGKKVEKIVATFDNERDAKAEAARLTSLKQTDSDTEAWVALALKRMMRYAADNGYDKVAFINGEQSADRYKLSNSVNEITWRPNGSTGRSVKIDTENGTLKLLASPGEGVSVRSDFLSSADGKNLEDIVGKDVAGKIFAEPKGKLSGEGLDIGGSGMKAFYDAILPQVANSLLKKMGGKLETVRINTKGADSDFPDFAKAGVMNAVRTAQPGFTVPEAAREPLPMFSTNRIVGDSGRPYTQDLRDFYKAVGRDIEQKNLIERTLDYLKKDFFKKMAVGMVDQFRGLRDLNDNGAAYLLARLSKGTAGAFDAFLHHGKLSIKGGAYDADRTGGFVQRLGVPLHGELDDFLWWVAANRAEYLMPQDREHLFTDELIHKGKTASDDTTTWDYTIQTGPTKGQVTRNRAEIYADANRVFQEFQKNALDMAEQSGLIDGASRKYWENEFYVPFYRVSEESGEFIGKSMGNALVRQEAFKKLKGGTDKLNSDLLSNTLLNISHLLDASAKNRAAKASLEAAEKMGVAQRVAYNMGQYKAAQNTANPMLPPGTKNTVWYMGDITETIPKGQKYEENGVTKVSDGTDEITYVGKVEYKVTDPFVMTAITSLEYAGMNNGIMKPLSQFKHWLTIGVTASPAFKVRNLIRDSVQAIGTSDLSYNPIANVVTGFKQTNRDSQEYVSALASGALIRFGTMLEGNESARTRQLIRSGVKDSTILNSDSKVRAFYDRFLEPALEAYNELGNRSEEINRAALYNQLIKQGKSHAEAALMARDLMDFSMQGSFNTVRFLTQVVPFLNARLQGLYKLGRSGKDYPRKMAVVTGAAALLSIGLMLAYEDDDEWKRREDWDRDNYWWIKIGGEAFRIPKPFEIGAVATMAERSLEYMINDEMTGERFLHATRKLITNQLAMNPVPQAFKPIIDLYANNDSFTDRPIESMGMQRLDSEKRYNSSTSMTARGASQAIGGALSPVQIDHLVRSYFGWLGSFVNGGADMAARAMSNEPTKPTMDYWKFATQGIVSEADGGSSRYVSQMYEQAKELEQAHATWRSLLKDGKVEEAKAYREDNADKLRRYGQVEAVKKIETNYNQRIHRIEISDIDPDQKKEQIKNINKLKEAAAKRIAPGVNSGSLAPAL